MNPLILIYQELNAEIMRNTFIANTIKSANLITYQDAKVNPLQQKGKVINASDTPEMLILISGVTPAPNDSTHQSFSTQWQFLTSTNVFDPVTMLNITFSLLQVYSIWKTSLLKLKWKGNVFVNNINFTSALLGLSDPQRNRNIDGWSSNFNLNVDFSVNIQDMLDNTLE